MNDIKLLTVAGGVPFGWESDLHALTDVLEIDIEF